MGTDHHVETPRRVYDSSAADYLGFVGTDLSPATEDPVDLAILAAFTHMLRSGGVGGTIADLGCGPGRAAAHIARERLDVIGVDVSWELLIRARGAHPNVPFTQGRLDELPFADAALAGVVCWYSIIYTPPVLLAGPLSEFARVTVPGGLVVLAYHAGSGEALARTNAHSTGMTLTTYLHHVDHLNGRLDAAGFDVHASAVRSPALPHETAQQAFVIARRR